jgi:hypothetical protein
MPSYVKSPFKPSPVALYAGIPVYLFGSYNDKTGPTTGNVLSDSGNGTTSTVVFQIQSGNIPFINALVTIVGTGNASGNYNVTNVTVTGVSTTTSGICTITFQGAGNSSSTADTGMVIIPQPELADNVSANGASVPTAIAFQNAQSDQGRSLTAIVSFPVLPTAAIVTLQQAIQDNDAEYQDVATVISVAGGAATGGQITLAKELGRFYRFNVSGFTASGNQATVVGKLLG